MKILFDKNLINLIWKVTFNCYKNHYYLRPCSSVVEQYPEKVCVVSAILPRPPLTIFTHRNIIFNLIIKIIYE